MNQILTWYGCYDESWKDFITPESFAHPAKMAHGLLRRIIQHGFEQHYWKVGDLISDPFGGIGSTGILCSYNGLRSVSVELEPRFVALAQQNFALHRNAWEKLGLPVPVLVQGDSREFSLILQRLAIIDGLQSGKELSEIVGQASGIVTSPPYAETVGNKNGIDYSKAKGPKDGLKPSAARDNLGGPYSANPQNIGNLKQGTLGGVITSPPYAESIKGDHFERETAEETRAKRNTAGGSLGQSQRHGGYGASDGNIGNLKEGSLAGAITSPPFDGQMNQGGAGSSMLVQKIAEQTGRDPTKPARATMSLSKQWGENRDNIGNSTGQTYWQAMRAVYDQMRLALKPGGVAAIVLKAYVKKGAIVDLPGDTLKLLLSLGFQPLERIRAMLVKETRENTLFEGEIMRMKERKSFFRRLAEARGSPRIDYEELLFVRAPAAPERRRF